ncbi:MAG: 50S ribosome-binding GTPase [Nanoarchaeota archaeon]|nr:50S ribosome-binding GTPase [Nanoarchaeota archaeon]
MPINATYEYGLAEEGYHEAQTTEERIKALQKMLSTAPSHKGSEKLRDEIKRKLAKARDLLKKEKGKKGGGGGIGVKREGDACVCLVGVTNSGKSTLLKALTGAKVKVSEHDFTTFKPEVGIMNYSGVKVQVVEVPAIVRNYYETENGPSFLGVIRMCDVVIFVVDMLRDVDKQVKLVKSELEKNDIHKKSIVVGLKGENGLGIDEARERIWKSLGLIKIHTKDRNKKKMTGIPVALSAGSNVRDFAMRIHKDFIKRNKKTGINSKKQPYARIWGPSAKFDGQQVGMEHILEDGDVVELFENR